jgi:hypothetical protein
MEGVVLVPGLVVRCRACGVPMKFIRRVNAVHICQPCRDLGRRKVCACGRVIDRHARMCRPCWEDANVKFPVLHCSTCGNELKQYRRDVKTDRARRCLKCRNKKKKVTEQDTGSSWGF